MFAWSALMNIPDLALVNTFKHLEQLVEILNEDQGAEIASANGGCCETGVERLISFTNTTRFPTANIKT